MAITFKGETIEVEGNLPKVGLQAPDFTVKDLDGKLLTKQDLHGKVVIISVVPDIDTSVCSTQSKKFNEYAKNHPNVEVISISNNTAETLKAWKEANEATDIKMYHEATQFAKDYGVYLPAFNQAARSVFVLDANGEVIYQELVSEYTNTPDFDKAIAAADSAVQ